MINPEIEVLFPYTNGWNVVSVLIRRLTVQTVVTWANEGVLWELMPIRNTVDWKMYMEVVFERGWPLAMLVQSHEKPQVASADEENEDTRSAQMEEQAEGEKEEERNEEVHVTETDHKVRQMREREFS